MRFASYDHFGISVWKIAAAAAAASALAVCSMGVVVGDSLGQAKPAAMLVVGALVGYIVLSTPRRLLDAQRGAQARESVLLSAEANACLSVMGSRSRMLVLLRSRDASVARALTGVARLVLLGTRVDAAVDSCASSLASYSATASLRGMATLNAGSLDESDEEARGLASSSELSNETKLPMFMTACFFAPIMLLFYAAFSHSYDPGSLAELAAFEFIVIDVAFFLSSAERGSR